MKLQIEVEIEPFPVPDFVSRKIVKPSADDLPLMEDGPLNISLENVDPETLSQLCDEFRAAVFAKAQKTAPATIAEGKV